MKRLLLIALVALFAVAPFAHAQSCSPYACRVGSCPWTEILIDGSFNSPSCHAWSYIQASLSSGSICNWTSTPYALLQYPGLISHSSSVYQTFATMNGATDLDNFSIQYIIDINGMTAGDTVKVTVTDQTTGAKITTDTFTADTWCNSVSHTYNGAGWKGHNLQVKWQSTLADTATTVKVTNATFWQEHQ